MPCRDDGVIEYKVDQDKVDQVKELKKRLDTVTRAACEMGAVLTKDAQLDRLSKSTRQWLEDHNQRDNLLFQIDGPLAQLEVGWRLKTS